ncbi:MAG: elongator complex protein 3 [Saccharofermentanales bacterium]
MSSLRYEFLPDNRLLGDKYGDRRKVIPIFIAHMGCPNQCVFCDQRHISGSADIMTPEYAIRICDQVLSQKPGDILYECAFYGGSFTGIASNLMEEYLRIPFERGLPIRLSTRPDYINEGILCLLKHYNVQTIELGAQSMDETVLRLSKRNHTPEHTIKAVEMIRNYGFELGIQTMIGLPGDTSGTAAATARSVCGLQPDLVRIYPALVLKDTELYDLYLAGTYVPMTLAEAIPLSAELLGLYDQAGIRVIRLGLQSGNEISARPDSKVAAGPYHSAFRQLSESYLLASYIADAVENISEIESGRDAAQFFRGHDAYGLGVLCRLTGQKIAFRIRPELEPNIIRVFNGGDAEPRIVVL